MSEAKPIKASSSLLYCDDVQKVVGAELMQILRCSICMEFFDVPIVLPCGHTFCLPCLTQMCKHACRNHTASSPNDVRIGCPNCRVLIYASPILNRNVTCNFVIQSLIECLCAKGRESLTSGNTDDDSNSTAALVHGGNPNGNDGETRRLLNDFDRLTNTLTRTSILDYAFLDIDEVRKEHLSLEQQRQDQKEARTRHRGFAVKNNVNQSREQYIQHHHQQWQPQQQKRQILPRPQQNSTPKFQTESMPHTSLQQVKSFFPCSLQQQNLHLDNLSQNFSQSPLQRLNRQVQQQNYNSFLQNFQQLQNNSNSHHHNHHNCQQFKNPAQDLMTPNQLSATSATATTTLSADSASALVRNIKMAATSTSASFQTTSGRLVGASSPQTAEVKTASDQSFQLNNDPAVMSFSLLTNTTSASGQQSSSMSQDRHYHYQ